VYYGGARKSSHHLNKCRILCGSRDGSYSGGVHESGEWMIGERVAGKYELKRVLGTGAMGAVYEGVHVDIGKRLAIKLILPEFCESLEVVARFRREARAASAVESEYIAQIYDFGRDDRLGLYMVIEYLEGEDLEARLARERWISEKDTAAIGMQAARGLSKAHAAGIVHRDLKPANVFLTERDDGSILAKILDFGISKFEPGTSSFAGPVSLAEPTLTALGTTLGTPQYMSPEQCEGKVALDARTDVWSLAAVLYEMIAGEPAISDAGGHIAAMQRIVRTDVPPLAGRASWVSQGLAGVIDAGLVRDRDKRIPNAAAFLAKLLDVYPDAGHRPSFTSPIAARTDISQLGPPSVPEPPSTESDPAMRARAAVKPPGTGDIKPLAPVKIADTGNPASSKPEPPSSAGDSVQMFMREKDMPRELVELRKKAKAKRD
jgi:eukaryotic-like serine/threonine-protein kinase